MLQDIQFKVQRHQQQVMYRTNIRHDCPWKLHQVQDAGNHLRQAILQIEKIDKETVFKYFAAVFFSFFNIVVLRYIVLVNARFFLNV